MPELRMPYMGLAEPESDSERWAIEASIPPNAVMVTGQQRAGTRLMCRILEEGGFQAWHDSRHGMVRRPVQWVVVMRREREASLASIEQHFEPGDRIDPLVSLGRCAEWYPGAAWVDYDQLCAMPDKIIRELALWLGAAPWPMPEPIVPSENTRRPT